MHQEHFYKILELAKHHFSTIAVKWIPPKTGFVKFNLDGCSKGNPGSCGGCGIIRDEKGIIIAAYVIPLSSKAYNMAEALTLKVGIY